MVNDRCLTKFEKDLLKDTYSKGTENTRKRLREMYKGLITF
tara:strand:- start:115 stop:237 length:123 start_codon:yes stop_codon:yes gene_type:complete